MPQTFFKNLTRSHGRPVTVEYQMEGETCACIVSKWPHTDEYSRLSAERRDLEVRTPPSQWDDAREKLRELDSLIDGMERDCLSSEEMERIEQWLSEEHVQTADTAF